MSEPEELAAALNEAPSRRDLIAEQVAEISRPSEEPAEVSAGEPKPERARGADGKFIPVTEAKPVAPKAAKETKEEVQAPIAPQEQPEPVWKTKIPQSWKKDYHEVWATVPEKVREYVWQREEQMKQGVQPLLEKAQFADSMRQAIEPHMQTMRGLGIEPAVAVKGLLEADHILRTSPPEQKLAYLVKIAQNYGVDLSQLTGAAQSAPPVDPNYHALVNELTGLKGQLRTWQEQQEAAQNQILQGEIEQFANAPGHEHYEAVKPTMAKLLQSGQASGLEDAYTKAVRLDDSLFESLISARQAAAIEDKDKAAKKARAAAVSVRGSTPGSHTATKAQTRREMLREGLGALDSRV